MKVAVLAIAALSAQLLSGDIYSSLGTPPPPPGIESWKFREELSRPSGALKLPRVGKGKKPWLENRISRCFFSPIKRPPYNRDELMDDVDYYPEAYLRRLANEGVNGLWLSVSFRDLAETSFTERSPDAERRLEKLRGVVGKCARHGIRIFLFSIEPASMPSDDPFAVKHPELMRTYYRNRQNMCAAEPEVRQYLYESVKDIFTRVPGLGGYINISNGERYTTCFSSVAPVGRYTVGCPRCSKLEPWQMHLNQIEPMARALKEVAPQARLISWFYHPQEPAHRNDWVYEASRHVPDNVTLQYNFESGAEVLQEGKIRHGGDYWLSYAGPSAPFARVARAAREAGTRIGAKIQMACSHEIATVPYVPAPGLLYRKYKAMKAEGVKDVMLCWFFGNYPGVMNRAAGELAHADFTEDEKSFLLRLAKDEWGEDAPAMAELWRKFSDGYSHYPMSIKMQYFGPFQSAPNWPLLPDVELKSLARTWLPDDPPSGDFIGECLMDFTLEDARVLAAKMCAPMYEKDPDGKDPLEKLRGKYAGNRERLLDLGVMEALRIIFSGAKDVLDFYALRRDAVFSSRAGDFAAARKAAGEMDAIIARQAESSRTLAALCRYDSRLGFHSEAQTHLFNDGSLEWRAGTLEKSRRRLGEIRSMLDAGKPWPLSEKERSTPVWKTVRNPDGGFTVEGDSKGADFVWVYTADLCGTGTVGCYTNDKGATLSRITGTVENGRFRIVVPGSDIPDDPRMTPAWVGVHWYDKNYRPIASLPPAPHYKGGTRWYIGVGDVIGENYGRLVLEEKK